MKDAADVLAESREYLDDHGWCRGRMQEVDGRVCAMGAICFSQGWDNMLLGPVQQALYSDVVQTLTEAIREELQFSEPQKINIPFWNDACARDKQAVLDMFMAAEKQLRSGNVEES